MTDEQSHDQGLTPSAWVVPVRVEQLGAHLQAYKDRTAARDSLQQCIEHGKGSIARLPPELVDHIVDYLQDELRDEYIYPWRSRYLLLGHEDQTYTLDFVKDHLLKDSYEGSLAEFLTFWNDNECEFCMDLIESTEPEQICTHCQGLNSGQTLWRNHPAAVDLADSLFSCDTWLDAIRDVGDEWLQAVKQGELLCHEQRELLREHFGLRAWIYNTNIFYAASGRRNHRSTTALLMLHDAGPEQAPGDREYRCVSYQDEWRSPWHHAGPNAEALQRGSATSASSITSADLEPEVSGFATALRELDLTPCAHVERHHRRRQDSADVQNGPWPKLMLLRRDLSSQVKGDPLRSDPVMVHFSSAIGTYKVGQF